MANPSTPLCAQTEDKRFPGGKQLLQQLLSPVHLFVFELVPLQTLGRYWWFQDPMDLAWPACGGLGMQRETSSGGEMAVLCETNLPSPRQLPNPPCVRGENLVLAVHLPELLLCLVQVAGDTQRCSCSPVLLCCRKKPKEMKKTGEERPVCL